MKNILQAFSLAFLLCCCNPVAMAQCVTGSAGGNANLIDDGGGSYSIACDGGDVDISATSPITAASNIIWTSGQTGDFTFSPDCASLGCQEFTPCVPSGTVIAAQCATFGSLGIPATDTGNSFDLDFTISGFCYTPGMTYSGELDINLSGSGNVSLSVLQPDGATQGPLTFDIDLINSISPVPLSLLNLDVDPNGDWSIFISGGGLTGYTIDLNSQICLDETTTSALVCGDPVEVCVFGGCPAFISAQASETEICSGGTFTLEALLDPVGAPNVNYTWSGNGIDAGNASSPSPMLAITNTTCAPVVETYMLTMTCTNDGSPVATNEMVTVTVFPEIDPAGVVIDNTTNVTDPGCSIEISYPACPAFAITGNTAFSPGDNGTTALYTISNGNAACDIEASALVNCLGDCTPPEVTVVVNDCATDQFTVDVTVVSMGDSPSFDLEASDGTRNPVSAAGASFNFGPYASGDAVNIKVLDPNDSACSVNLGEFTNNCFTCPNLTSIDPIPADVCVGDAITLVANVDAGTEVTDYSIQWFEDGIYIGAGATFNHTALAADRCNTISHTYSAVLTCLNNGVESTTDMMNGGGVNVYPVPVEGIDFVFTNCSATPIDNCGALTIDIGGAADPAPGSTTTVNWTVSVTGAPAACQATGSTAVSCSDCPDYPGNGSASDVVLCTGESFDFSNTSALVSSLGYEVGYVITTDPPATYGSTSALLAASINGTTGAFAAPGSITSTTFVNDGSLITPTDPCGEVLYFTPFLSFACQSYQAENSTGTVVTENADGLTVPGIGGVTLSVPQVPFCTGLVTYDIRVGVDDNSVDGEEPLQEDALFGIIDGLPGGIFSVFPNIDDVHDSCNGFFCNGFVNYNQNGWAQNPSGELISIVDVNLIGGTQEMDWIFQVDVNCNSTFPTICPDCDVLGAPVAVRFLPNITLAAIPEQGNLCEGAVVNLANLNPAASSDAGGTYSWTQAGAAIADPSAIVPVVGTTTYCVSYSYCETGDCNTETCVDITIDPLPVLVAPVLGPICQGESFDLTSTDASFGAGTVEWFVGAAKGAGGAALANAAAVTPVGSEQYCAEYTDPVTGCSNSVCASFTYNAPPVLLAAAPEACEGEEIDLADSNTDISTDATATFEWFDADPVGGATALASTVITNPVDGTEYWVTVTDDLGCASTTSIIITVVPAPVVTAPVVAICEGDAIDLSVLEADVTTAVGTFQWFEGSSDIGFPLTDLVVAPVAGSEYCVIFTEDATTCSAEVCFTPTINLLPVIEAVVVPPVCAGAMMVDLTANEAALATGTFLWYNDDPAAGGIALVDATAAAVPDAATTTFWFEVTDANDCAAIGSIDVTVYAEVVGALVSYDCAADALLVDLTDASGGSGAGYTVSIVSPNTNGDVLANGDPYTVIVEDGQGCTQVPLTGVVDCAACVALAGEPSPLSQDVCDTDLPTGPIDFAAFFGAETVDPGMATPTLSYLLVNANDTLQDSNLDGIFDPTNLEEIGDAACVYKVIYDQDELNAFITSANIELVDQGLFALLPVDGDLPSVFNLLNGLAGPFALNDILALVVTPGVVSLPNPLSPGNFLNLTIPELCINVSTDAYCVNVVSCEGCTAMAGEPDPVSEDVCLADLPVVGKDFAAFFGAETVDPGMVTPTLSYLLVNANDTLLNSNIDGTFDATELMEAGDAACVYKVIYDQEELNAFITSANIELVDQGLFALLPVDGDLPAIFNLLNTLAGPFALNDILALVVTPGVTTLPNPLSPGTFLNLTIPELCIDVSASAYCVNVVDCNATCSIDADGLAVGACVPATDTYSITLDPSGTDIGTTYTVSGDLTGNGTYGTALILSGTAGAGDLTLTITDDSDTNCSAVVVVSDPGSCAPVCDLTSDGLIVGACSDVGTPDDSTDDTFTVTLDPQGTATATTYTVSGDLSGTGTYGTALILTASSNGAGINIVITDDGDTNCSLSVSFTAPASCSTPVCVLTDAALITGICDDNGTPDPADDFYTVSVNPVGNAIGATFSVTGDATQASNPYGTSVGFNFLVADGDRVLTITDDVDPNCSIVANVTAPSSCSTACALDPVVLGDITCNDNGTDNDISDDFIEFTITVTGVSTAGTYTVSDAGGALNDGVYGNAETFQTMAGTAGFGDITITVTDDTDPACSTTVLIADPGICSEICLITSGSTAGGPYCSGDAFTVSIGTCDATANQDGLLIIYDEDLTNADPSLQDIYDDLFGVNPQADLVTFGETSACDGSGFVNLAGYNLPGCDPLTVNLYLVPANLAANSAIDFCAVEGPITLEFYPNYEVVEMGVGTCAPTVALNAVDAAGAILAECAALGDATVDCTDALNYDFSTDVVAGTPADCLPANLAGTVACACSGCTASFTVTSVVCDDITFGTDTYTVTIDFDNGAEGAPGMGGYTISQTFSGDNPMIAAAGTMTFNFMEGGNYAINIAGVVGSGVNETCSFDLSGNEPNCEPEATITNTDPSISDPCVCQDDEAAFGIGSFYEEVLIISAPGEVWTFVAGSSVGLLDAGRNNLADGTVVPEVSAGQYVLGFFHLDNAGYNGCFTNGTDVLCSNNICFYPDVTISGLSAYYCPLQSAVLLDATATVDGSLVTGTANFTIDGVSATIFDPMSLPLGVYTVAVSYTADGVAGTSNPGCLSSAETMVTIGEECNAGCMDPAFCEFDAEAIIDAPELCVTPTADPGTCDDGDCSNGIEVWDFSSCECVSIPADEGGFGCTDPSAFNYNVDAICDDGSCIVLGNGDCHGLERVCDGNALYVVPNPANLPISPLFIWYNTNDLDAPVYSSTSEYYSPTEAGTYTVLVMDAFNGSYTPVCQDYVVEELHSCKDCYDKGE